MTIHRLNRHRDWNRNRRSVSPRATSGEQGRRRAEPPRRNLPVNTAPETTAGEGEIQECEREKIAENREREGWVPIWEMRERRNLGDVSSAGRVSGSWVGSRAGLQNRAEKGWSWVGSCWMLGRFYLILGRLLIQQINIIQCVINYVIELSLITRYPD